jgi:hypothetical protein
VRGVVIGALLGATAVAAIAFVSWPAPSAPRSTERVELRERKALGRIGGATERADRPQPRGDLERRIKQLATKVDREASERQRLEKRLEDVAEQLAALGAGPSTTETARNTARSANERGTEGAAPDADTTNTAGAGAGENAMSAMERALTAAGIDSATAADIKRRRDEVAMMEIYLRDQATREQWLNTPRFAEEMAAIDGQRTSVREEIGDDAYDRYLFALGQTNRVRVDDVMLESVAAQAGLQAGDMILRYGDTRVFAPDALVTETRSGTAGEIIELDILRNGERFQVRVPRGPLGLHVAAAHAEPMS